MAFDTFTPPVRQSPGTKMKPEVKVLAAEFGDGYTLEGPDGANNVRMVADLKWDTLTEEQADAIFNFFVSKRGATPFYYALQDGTVRKWTCKVFDRMWETPNTVSATFRENFSLET